MYKRLQYISQGITPQEQILNIQKALDAGCEWIQLRYKTGGEELMPRLAEEVKEICANYKATFIINDHVSLAKLIDADGVHLGLTDMPVSAARAILGNKIVGGTANTYDDVVKRINEKADYVGLGPLRFTTTKQNLSPELGFTGYAEITRKLNESGISIPIYAIGGIINDDILPLKESGCYGVAISGAITNAESRTELVSQLKSMLHGSLENSR